MKKLILITLSFINSTILFSQDTLILKVSSVVGDTIELNEKIKFRLFTTFDNSTFDYAFYIAVKGKTIIKTKLKNGETTFSQYSIQELMQDAEKINYRNNIQAELPQNKTEGRIRLKVINTITKKSHLFKEGDLIYYAIEGRKKGIEYLLDGDKLYNDQYMMEARIIKILEQNPQSILIEVSGIAGDFLAKKIKKTILLSDIIEISTNDINRNISNKMGGAIMLFYGVPATALAGPILLLSDKIIGLPILISGGILTYFGIKNMFFRPYKNFKFNGNAEYFIVRI